MKDPVLHLPAQLQQKMLQPPVAQHGVPWVPSPHIQLEFPLPQHMALAESGLLKTNTNPKRRANFSMLKPDEIVLV